MIGNVLKRQTTIIAVTVIALCIGLLGISYAVFFKIDNSDNQVVTSGDLTIQFETKENKITTVDVPQSDIDGQNNVYTFSVTNQGSLPMIYDIYIYDDPDAIGQGTLIPHDYLKVQLDDQEVKLLKDYDVETTEGDDTSKSKINLNPLSVAAKGAEDNKDVKTHNVRIWIDEEAPESIVGNIVALKIEVFGEVGEVKEPPKPQSFTDVVAVDNTNIFADEAGNKRYAGANPNNYIWFNCDDYTRVTNETTATEQHCEKWRIIGVMKDVEKADNSTEDLVKIVRADSIGDIAWNSDNVNDWTNASLQKSLNGDYLNPNDSGTYTSSSSIRAINATTLGMIESVKWHLGGIGSTYETTGTPKVFYEAERGEETYCTTHTCSGDTRPTIWPGKVGLIYPSDYGYATSGGGDTTRDACLETTMAYSGWGSNPYNTDCGGNSWLKPSNGSSWTITPRADLFYGVFYVGSSGRVYNVAVDSFSVRPSLYLKSNVKIAGEGGNGSAEQPYILTS